MTTWTDESFTGMSTPTSWTNESIVGKTSALTAWTDDSIAGMTTSPPTSIWVNKSIAGMNSPPSVPAWTFELIYNDTDKPVKVWFQHQQMNGNMAPQVLDQGLTWLWAFPTSFPHEVCVKYNVPFPPYPVWQACKKTTTPSRVGEKVTVKVSEVIGATSLPPFGVTVSFSSPPAAIEKSFRRYNIPQLTHGDSSIPEGQSSSLSPYSPPLESSLVASRSASHCSDSESDEEEERPAWLYRRGRWIQNDAIEPWGKKIDWTRQIHCGICGEKGHNRRKCKNTNDFGIRKGKSSIFKKKISWKEEKLYRSIDKSKRSMAPPTLASKPRGNRVERFTPDLFALAFFLMLALIALMKLSRSRMLARGLQEPLLRM